MIPEGTFQIDPWSLREVGLNLELLPQTESLFALSNGLLGLRGNLDEGEPHYAPGTYLSGYYETIPLPHAESGYGYPQVGETLLNVTNGKLIRLLVDDHAFDLRYGATLHHERTLDFRAGLLHRQTHWRSPSGKEILVTSERLVSLEQRSIAAIKYRVKALSSPVRIVVQSTLVANEPLSSLGDDPRTAAALRAPLTSLLHRHHECYAMLGHQTQGSALRMAAGMQHNVYAESPVTRTGESEADMGRISFSTELQPGESLTLVKYVGYGWSSVRSMPALRDQVDAALASAQRSGWEGLKRAQRQVLSAFWQHADIELDGDPALQQALRYALFQVVQASLRAEQSAIPAKGLTGRGYDGHTFWDMDTYTAPVVTYTAPEAARDMLLYRYSTLEQAKARAKELKLRGAAFPWRTISGQECSGYWPAGTAAFHVNADIADAVRRYVGATGDEVFEKSAGLELLVETARLWLSLGHHDAEGRFRIDGVTGPDEYSALIDNNVFTNLMAARNLRVAAQVARKYPGEAAQQGVDAHEIASWEHASSTITVPFDLELGITSQSAGFVRYREWNFKGTPAEHYPLMLNYPYYLLYSSQVIKQADLVMALYLCGDHFTPEQKAKDFAYYEARTVRDSSLSAAIQAIVAAEVGHVDLAYAYFRETALIDLRDLANNTRDGLHLAALSGAWLVAVAGFGGMRDYGEVLEFSPRLPEVLNRLSFRLRHRNTTLRVTLSAAKAHYQLGDGDELDFLHNGELHKLRKGELLELALEVPTPKETVHPPSSREPEREGVGTNGRELTP